MNKIFVHIIAFVEREERRVITMLLAAVLLLGAAYSYYLGERLKYPDEGDYYSLAINLVNSHTYTLDGQSPTAIRPPGYPFILAVLSFFNSSIVFCDLLTSSRLVSLPI